MAVKKKNKKESEKSKNPKGFGEATTQKLKTKKVEDNVVAKPKPKKQITKLPEERPHFHGHRDRLRRKFEMHGAEKLADYEILELLLFRSIPRKDTKPIAKSLISTFGSVSGVLNAPIIDLKQVPDLGKNTALDLKAVAAAYNLGKRDDLREKKEILGSWSDVIHYCINKMAHENIEQFRILFLNKKNALIKDEEQQTGTIDHTPVYPREIIKRAIELNASALILVHNHPSGDPNPSQADIKMTNTIIEATAAMGILVHDHIIVGKNGHSSMKKLGLI